MAVTPFIQSIINRTASQGGTTVGAAYNAGARNTAQVGSYTPSGSSSNTSGVQVGSAYTPSSQVASASSGSPTSNTVVGSSSGYSPTYSGMSQGAIIDSQGNITKSDITYYGGAASVGPGNTQFDSAGRVTSTGTSPTSGNKSSDYNSGNQGYAYTPPGGEFAQKGQDAYNALTPEQIAERNALIASYKGLAPGEGALTYGAEGPGRRGVGDQTSGSGDIIGWNNTPSGGSSATGAAPTGGSGQVGGVNGGSGMYGGGVSGGQAGGMYGGGMAGGMAGGVNGMVPGSIGSGGYGPGAGIPGTGMNSTGVPYLDQILANSYGMYQYGNMLANEELTLDKELKKRQYMALLMKSDAASKVRPDMTLEELEQLRAFEMTNLSQEEIERVTYGGELEKQAINAEKDMRKMENDYATRQMERQMGRALEEQERFNIQQDTKMRRMLGMFGGGEAETLAGNAAVLHSQSQGQQAMNDLRAEFADKEMLMGARADKIITDWTIKTNQVNSQMAGILEDNYNNLVSGLDELEVGVLIDENEARQQAFSLFQDYTKTHNEVLQAGYEISEQLRLEAKADAELLKQENRAWGQAMQEATGWLYDMNGNLYRDPDTGEPVRTMQGQVNDKNLQAFQNEEDRWMTQQTGYVYANGQRLKDPVTGEPMTTLGMMQEQRLGMDQSGGMGYYPGAEYTGMQYAGGNTISPGAVNPSWSGSLEMSTYKPVVNQDGSITVPIATGAFGKDLPKKRWDGRDLNQSNYQCGEFVNDFLGAGVMKDTYAQKMEAVSTMTPSVGSAFVMNGGQYGHTGIVEAVNGDGSISIVDANANGSGKIRRTTLYLDPSTGKYKDGGRYIQGFTQGIYGGTGTPMQTPGDTVRQQFGPGMNTAMNIYNQYGGGGAQQSGGYSSTPPAGTSSPYADYSSITF